MPVRSLFGSKGRENAKDLRKEKLTSQHAPRAIKPRDAASRLGKIAADFDVYG